METVNNDVKRHSTRVNGDTAGNRSKQGMAAESPGQTGVRAGRQVGRGGRTERGGKRGGQGGRKA